MWKGLSYVCQLYVCSQRKKYLFTSKASCFPQVHNILAEMVMGGMVLETNMNEIITQVDAQNKMEKSEVSVDLFVHCMYDFYAPL